MIDFPLQKIDHGSKPYFKLDKVIQIIWNKERGIA